MIDVTARLLAVEDGVVAVDKPAGLSSIGLTLDDEACLQHLLLRHFDRMVWGVHQLDKATSGVNLFVLEKRLVDACRRLMTPPIGEKRYVALCAGRPARDRFSIESPIGYLDEDRRLLGVSPSGKAAATDVVVLARGEDASLLDVRLRTGRTHQIRIHLAHAGHPLLGEPWYGGPAGAPREVPCPRAPRQMLHARSVRLGGESERCFVAPWPEDLRHVARQHDLALPEDGATP